MLFPRLAAAALLFAAAAASAAPPATTGRLPAGVTPTAYTIRVAPDARAMRFTGSEDIEILVARPTARIVLNAAELTVGGALLDGVTKPAQVLLDAAAQTLTLTFATPVAPGPHRLSIGFAGRIATTADGLFAVDYGDARAPQRMLVTQFEPADARRLAPMWDEPAAKAVFRLSVTVPKGQTAFANMPIADTQKAEGGASIVTFQPTPRMASYLLFFGIGDVERRTTKVGNTEIGIITRRGAIDQGDYALASAARLLAYYNDYFGTPYPLPKLDMIAAPGSSQFFSAMENWGAILYFDRAVLVDPKLTTENARQNVFITVAHEMAHQWFGDLVTMRWWDDLWLNEGFASWMESKAANDLNPSWNQLAQDAAFARQSAIVADARATTHPIVQHIETVDQVAQAFDTITYSKGQATIRMIEDAIGPDVFRAGVRRYMAHYKYGNTETDQLWAELAASAGRPVKPFADSFTLQGGVPLIRASEPACRAGRTTLTLAQERFGLDAASRAPRRWIVPVRLEAGAAPARLDVSGPAPRAASVAGCGVAVLNPGQRGYYRTLLADRHFAALEAGFGSLALADQVGLVADALALGDGGYAPLARWLALLDHIPADADPLVWNLVATELSGVDGVLTGDPVQPAFRHRAIALLAPQFARTGFRPARDEPPAASQLREQLIGSLGRFGDRRVVEGARKLVAGGIDDLPAAIREPVIAAYAYNATPDQWEALHARARAEKDPAARASLYGELAVAADPALAARALDLALTDEATVPIRAALVAGVARDHPELAFDWAVARPAQVNALVGGTSQPAFIVNLAIRSTDARVADRVRAYAGKAITPDARSGADNVVNGITYRARLRRDRAGPVAAWAGAGL